MNLVGKIFIVLICVMSLVFMAFALAVYSAHVNWMDKVKNPETGLEAQLQQQKAINEQLTQEKDNLDKQIKAEAAAKRQALAALETQNDMLKRERDQLQADQAKLVQSEREAVATMAQSQKTLAALRQEVDQLRNDIRTAQKDRDTSFNSMVQLTDQLNNAKLQYESLESRSKTLAADLAAAREVLAKFDLEGDPARYKGIPWRVTGRVKAVSGGNLVELDIGSDDGLMKGHKLEVYREANGGIYLGRVEVIETAPEKAVAKILPEYRKGTIQEGDRVASKLE
jgi:SMC interacting uncharacterized protein involved in chromosome segregation